MEKLKMFRKEKGLSQDAMARKLGITLSMYEKVEQGRAGASAAFMKRVKSTFPEVDINDIFFEPSSNDVAVATE
jgi:transcriptional regulator with XRE-family HTH domain